MNYVFQNILLCILIHLHVRTHDAMYGAIIRNAEKYPHITEENHTIHREFRKLDQEYHFGVQYVQDRPVLDVAYIAWMVTNPFGAIYNMLQVGSHWEEYSNDAALSQLCWRKNCRQTYLSMAITEHNIDVVKETLHVVKRQQCHSIVLYITLWCSCLIYFN